MQTTTNTVLHAIETTCDSDCCLLKTHTIPNAACVPRPAASRGAHAHPGRVGWCGPPRGADRQGQGPSCDCHMQWGECRLCQGLLLRAILQYWLLQRWWWCFASIDVIANCFLWLCIHVLFVNALFVFTVHRAMCHPRSSTLASCGTLAPAAQSLGADQVVDYTCQDLVALFKDTPFDGVVDLVGGVWGVS